MESFESQLDAKAQGFQKIAADLRLTVQEYDKVFEDLSEYSQPMTEKHRELEERGTEIK